MFSVFFAPSGFPVWNSLRISTGCCHNLYIATVAVSLICSHSHFGYALSYLHTAIRCPVLSYANFMKGRKRIRLFICFLTHTSYINLDDATFGTIMKVCNWTCRPKLKIIYIRNLSKTKATHEFIVGTHAVLRPKLIYSTAKKHLLFWQLQLLPELQLLTRNSPLWQPAMSIQQTWSIGTAELLQGLGSLLRHQISAIHNKEHCSLAKILFFWTVVLTPICDLF